MLRPGTRIRIADDLRISIGDRVAVITPTQGLRLSERLARKSFRRMLAEEAARTDDDVVSEKPQPRASGR